MRPILGLSALVAACAAGYATAQSTPIPPSRAGGDVLVWQDEFDQPGLPDSSRWNYEEGLVRNKERQYYTRARSENEISTAASWRKPADHSTCGHSEASSFENVPLLVRNTLEVRHLV